MEHVSGSLPIRHRQCTIQSAIANSRSTWWRYCIITIWAVFNTDMDEQRYRQTTKKSFFKKWHPKSESLFSVMGDQSSHGQIEVLSLMVSADYFSCMSPGCWVGPLRSRCIQSFLLNNYHKGFFSPAALGSSLFMSVKRHETILLEMAPSKYNWSELNPGPPMPPYLYVSRASSSPNL